MSKLDGTVVGEDRWCVTMGEMVWRGKCVRKAKEFEKAKRRIWFMVDVVVSIILDQHQKELVATRGTFVCFHESHTYKGNASTTLKPLCLSAKIYPATS